MAGLVTIVQGDIARCAVNAIVDAADEALWGGGGFDGDDSSGRRAAIASGLPRAGRMLHEEDRLIYQKIPEKL